MGLDSVELMMGFEERFDIDIPDADAMQIATVGDMHRYLCRRLLHVRRRTCETQRTFYQVRRALMRISEVPRWYVRPDTRLDLALPATPIRRRHALRRLRHETSVQMTWDPAEHVTVGSLVRLSVAQAEERRRYSLSIPSGGWTEGDIWDEMKKVIVRELDVAESKVCYDARFVQDLGMD